MQHFFVPPSQVEETQIHIWGSDVNHMKHVLRMKPGEEVTVSDGNNCRYLCRIKEYIETESKEEAAVLDICEKSFTDTELASKIYLFQGLPKQEKMELIVQKAVELGVCEVIPVTMKRCVVKLDQKKGEKKVKRWQEIAKSAAKQSGRGIIPEVTSVMSWKEALQYAGNMDVVFLPYELAENITETKRKIHSVSPGKSIGIFIGPEGGFEKEEVEEAVKEGAEMITLGKRILRTETAGLAILSVLMFHLEG